MGKIVTVPLFSDQTGFNEVELTRVRAEHPEELDIISAKTGRILSSTSVTRAFGDGLWKWPSQIIEGCHAKFWWPRPLQKYKTPPYLTAEAIVTTKQLRGEGEFLFMASDGLCDHLSNVRLWQEAHLNGRIGNLDGNPLPTSTSARGFREGWQAKDENFVVKDENAAAHLVRNTRSLGFGIQAPLSREIRYACTHGSISVRTLRSDHGRDDITVQVIFFEILPRAHDVSITGDRME